MATYIAIDSSSESLAHYRTKGSKNGVRLYQNPDGSYTALGAENGGRYSQHANSIGRYKSDKNYSSKYRKADRQLTRDRKNAQLDSQNLKALREAVESGDKVAFLRKSIYNGETMNVINPEKYLKKHEEELAKADEFLKNTRFTRIYTDVLFGKETLDYFDKKWEHAEKEKVSKESMEADILEATDELTSIINNGAGRDVDDGGEAVYKSAEEYMQAASASEKLYSEWSTLDAVERTNYEVAAGVILSIRANSHYANDDGTYSIPMSDVAHVAAVYSNFTDGDGGDGMSLWAYDNDKESEVASIANCYSSSKDKLWNAISKNDQNEHYSTFTSARKALIARVSPEARSTIGICSMYDDYSKYPNAVSIADKLTDKLPAASSNGTSGWQAFNKVIKMSMFSDMDVNDLSDADWAKINAKIAKLV